uniref:Uncharacterized protein n=1 Tax=Arundo donax TaxID=35708 RepID=A0A0A8XS35_ARUDO
MANTPLPPCTCLFRDDEHSIIITDTPALNTQASDMHGHYMHSRDTHMHTPSTQDHSKAPSDANSVISSSSFLFFLLSGHSSAKCPNS